MDISFDGVKEIELADIVQIPAGTIEDFGRRDIAIKYAIGGGKPMLCIRLHGRIADLTTERERELLAEIDALKAKLAEATKLTIDDDGNAELELAADVSPAEAE